MAAATQFISIVDDEIVMKLSPMAIAQIDQDRLQTNNYSDNKEVIYRLDSSKLLQVLASSLGIASLRRGAIIIWTYFEEDASNAEEPILRTLMTVDGDLTQKICQEILEHPLADRLLKVHSYLISQISQQMATVFSDYIDRKIRPLEIICVTCTAAITWNDQLIALGKRLNFSTLLTDILLNQYGVIFITSVVVILWQLRPVEFLPITIQRAVAKLFSSFQLFLEQKYLQYFVIAATSIFIICAIASTQKFFSPNIQAIINELKIWTEPYLPIALISLRKHIINQIGKIFLRIPFLMKLIFGRFIR